jgi:hypothetical protein
MPDIIETIQASNKVASRLWAVGDRLIACGHTENKRLKKSLHKMTIAQLRTALVEANPTGTLSLRPLRYKYSSCKPWGAAPNMEVSGSNTEKALYIEALMLVASLQRKRA